MQGNKNINEYMDYQQEFATVNLIINSKLETRGVDSFILSLIKAEKQMRRIFTYLIFQNPVYTLANYSDLRQTLANNRKIYFSGFPKGIDMILPKSLKDIYGEDYEKDIAEIIVFAKDRNKIFHGQITSNGLSRDDLINRVDHIKNWCKTLGIKLKAEIEYDGFSDSYRKSTIELNLNNMGMFDSIEKYKYFLEENLQR